jgi:hypothetical protein
VIACLAFAAGAAYAQTSPTTDGYPREEAQIQDIGGTSGGPPAQEARAESGTGALPFTGLQIGLVLAVGGALVGTGLVTRRVTRSHA